MHARYGKMKLPVSSKGLFFDLFSSSISSSMVLGSVSPMVRKLNLVFFQKKMNQFLKFLRQRFSTFTWMFTRAFRMCSFHNYNGLCNLIVDIKWRDPTFLEDYWQIAECTLLINYLIIVEVQWWTKLSGNFTLFSCNLNKKATLRPIPMKFEKKAQNVIYFDLPKKNREICQS